METRSKRKRLGPLPGGDRRGAPGADAGCHSMRTVSGEELSRRAPTDKDTTAEITDDGDRQTDRTNTPVEPYSPSTVSYTPSRQSSLSLPSSPSIPPSPPTISLNTIPPTPTLNVAREASSFLPASTKAGKARVRMKWSKEVNLFIMRTYFYITKLETDMTTYRQELHELFTRQYPEISVTEQRVSDQRRAIIRNKLLPQAEIDQLKEEIRLKIQVELENIESTTISTLTQNALYSQEELPQSITHSQTFGHSQAYSQTTHTSTQTESITIMLENEIETLNDTNITHLTDIYTQGVHDKFKTALTQYSGMDPAA